MSEIVRLNLFIYKIKLNGEGLIKQELNNFCVLAPPK